jgi:hypothetical protein
MKGDMAYQTGARVKCITDIGPVKAGTSGTVTQPFPEADSSWVLFDGATSDTLVANQSLEPVFDAPARAKGRRAHQTGTRVRCRIDIGVVKAGTAGTVRQPFVEAEASWVRFDGTTGDTLVANQNLEPA